MREGGLGALPGGVALHLACHARAQNMGAKAAEMLRLVPEAELAVIARCSGHGGSGRGFRLRGLKGLQLGVSLSWVDRKTDACVSLANSLQRVRQGQE